MLSKTQKLSAQHVLNNFYWQYVLMTYWIESLAFDFFLEVCSMGHDNNKLPIHAIALWWCPILYWVYVTFQCKPLPVHPGHETDGTISLSDYSKRHMNSKTLHSKAFIFSQCWVNKSVCLAFQYNASIQPLLNLKTWFRSGSLIILLRGKILQVPCFEDHSFSC
jgi:hypothetical protein